MEIKHNIWKEIAVNNCARCGKNHKKVTFFPFEIPPEETWTHWGKCPVSLDPILLIIKNND